MLAYFGMLYPGGIERSGAGAFACIALGATNNQLGALRSPYGLSSEHHFGGVRIEKENTSAGERLCSKVTDPVAKQLAWL